MKKLIVFLFIGFSSSGFSQKTLSKLLKVYNDESIPYISVEDLKTGKEPVILMDSREQKEYKTSHLKNAIHVGYTHFKIDSVQKTIPNKESKIVVYCSVGVRSESIADSLKKVGYNNVYNLFGGIFEWKNNDLPVYNAEEKETDTVHTFSKEWSKWLTNGIKVYD
ncbi:rhodanese-like domain-containing protein [Changchengzhania lutea]|uniref:rhodanese-like domain-containing protein n=1 Tax=Changchengzhania lutea TaxID=2049305 RepID=UPI00115DBD19|nr:rhodanese-like domain-containing protein [Changchengzhania lutea]